MERVSIHIVTRDRQNFLAILLSSLMKQTYKAFDLVIYDSSEGEQCVNNQACASIIKRMELEGHRFKIVMGDKSIRDIGTLRNKVIEEDQFGNKWAVRIDDDSFCDPDYIELLVGGIGEHVGVVGGIVPYMWVERMYRQVPSKFNEVTENYMWTDNCIFFYNTPRDRYFEAGHVRSSYMYNVALAKEIRFPEWSGPSGFTEETVFCIKVWMKGYKVLFNPHAVCWHFNAVSGGGRDMVSSQEQMEKIKWENMKNLVNDLDKFREECKAEKKGYP